MRRKVTVIVVALLAIVCCMPAEARTSEVTSTSAADARITYVGRTSVSPEGDVSFSWSGVSVRIAFEGNYLAIHASDTHRNYYNVWLDASSTADEPDKVIAIEGDRVETVLFDEADFKVRYGRHIPSGPHEVILQKRTEGEQGTTTLHTILTEGRLLQAAPLKERMIEFIGDSYTCGYGTEGKSAQEHFTAETENSNFSYWAIVSRYFDADAFVVAHSGWGICRNYNDMLRGDHMPLRYLHTHDSAEGEVWNAQSSAFRPALTVILLGTNDFSCDRQPSLSVWRDAYITLLKEIKANYGDSHPILCTAARGDAMVYEYVKAAVEASGLSNVWHMSYGMGTFSDMEMGSDWHPNYTAHRKIAYSIIPYISTLTGWSLEDNPVK